MQNCNGRQQIEACQLSLDAYRCLSCDLVIDFFDAKPDGASSSRRDLKQSHSTRTKRKAIANIQQSCSDSDLIANQMDGVFGTDTPQPNRTGVLSTFTPSAELVRSAAYESAFRSPRRLRYTTQEWPAEAAVHPSQSANCQYAKNAPRRAALASAAMVRSCRNLPAPPDRFRW